jgi:hypothetical protein
MNQPSSTTTIRTHLRATALWSICLLLACAVPALAHGGFDHVIGTVVTVSNNVLTVKTAKGNVDVKLDDKTEITKSDQKAQIADLKPGTRVVVEIPEGSKDRIAHSVKLGAASASHDGDHHHE